LIKSDIRKLIKKKRIRFSKKEIQSISGQIISQLIEAFDLKTMTINLFLPIERFHEIDLKPLLNSNKCKRIGVNKADFEKQTMTSYLYVDKKQIRINTHDIPEPVYGDHLKPTDFDLVIVPLLAFNKEGCRVGYGKGFYDLFLSECRTDCLFVGVNHFNESIEIDDIESHDIPLDFVVTPEKTIKFN
jgi:5-formyltetrahydrofolate cyclo-ligase